MKPFTPQTESCLQLATIYHSHQKLLTGQEPYIDHVRIVTAEVREYLSDSSVAVQVAAFHDILYEETCTVSEVLQMIGMVNGLDRNKERTVAIAEGILNELYDPFYPQLRMHTSGEVFQRKLIDPIYPKSLSVGAATIRLCCICDNLSRLFMTGLTERSKNKVMLILDDIPRQLPMLKHGDRNLILKVDRLLNAIQNVYYEQFKTTPVHA